MVSHRIAPRRAFVAAVLLVGTRAFAQPGERVFELAIAGGKVPAAQRRISVRKGEGLRIKMKSDAGGELHIHGYRIEAKLAAGAPAEVSFVARATGLYKIEWHPATGGANATSHRHGDPMAVLEVMPR